MNDEANRAFVSSQNSFPSPADVLRLDVPQLKSAGLSTRKAEYGELFSNAF